MGSAVHNAAFGSVHNGPGGYGIAVGQRFAAPTSVVGVRRAIRGDRGLSEIVGTLFLVLIVVAAATAFSVFVAQYQQQVQAEQAQAHDRALESFRIYDPVPTLNRTAGIWEALNITIASGDVNPSVVTGLEVNGEAVRQYLAFGMNLTTGNATWELVGAGGDLRVGPHGLYHLLLNFSQGANFSFYDPFVLLATDYLKLDVLTVYQNDFAAVFLPPTAIAIVTPLQTWNGTAFVTIPVLDGSYSTPGGNATVESWSWFIQPENVTVSGEKVVAPFTNLTALHVITLTVTNTDGLEAVDQVTFRYP